MTTLLRTFPPTSLSTITAKRCSSAVTTRGDHRRRRRSSFLGVCDRIWSSPKERRTLFTKCPPPRPMMTMRRTTMSRQMMMSLPGPEFPVIPPGGRTGGPRFPSHRWLATRKGKTTLDAVEDVASPGDSVPKPFRPKPVNGITRGEGEATTATTEIPPIAVFPWRHHPDPLPRLIPGTEEYIKENGPRGKALPKYTSDWWLENQLMGAYNMFCAGVTKQFCLAVVTPGRLEQEFAETCAWAFHQTVETLVSCPLNAPSSKSKVEEGTLSPNKVGEVDQSMEKSPSEGRQLDHRENAAADDEKENGAWSALSGMVERNLLELYRSAASEQDSKMQVLLRTRPVSWEVVNWAVIPFLTRDHVENKPELRGCMFSLVEELEAQWRAAEMSGAADVRAGKYPRWGAEFEKFAKQADASNKKDLLTITVVVQVLVHCMEAFAVRDADSGTVLQGYPDEKEREVPHLVRFEQVLTFSPPVGEKRDTHPVQRGPWKITDWDDLLDGNLWF